MRWIGGWWVQLSPLLFMNIPTTLPCISIWLSAQLSAQLSLCSGLMKKNVVLAGWLRSRRVAGRVVGRLVMLSCHRGLPLFLRTSIQSRLLSPNLRLHQVVATPSLHTERPGSCRHQYSTATSPPWPTGARLAQHTRCPPNTPDISLTDIVTLLRSETELNYQHHN